MFVLVATTVIVVLVVYVLSFLTQDILYLKRFVCVCVCVCTAPSLKPHTPSFPCKQSALNSARRGRDFITQWGRVRECGA